MRACPLEEQTYLCLAAKIVRGDVCVFVYASVSNRGTLPKYVCISVIWLESYEQKLSAVSPTGLPAAFMQSWLQDILSFPHHLYGLEQPPLFPTTFMDWNNLQEEMATAPNLELFQSRLSPLI